MRELLQFPTLGTRSRRASIRPVDYGKFNSKETIETFLRVFRLFPTPNACVVTPDRANMLVGVTLPYPFMVRIHDGKVLVYQKCPKRSVSIYQDPQYMGYVLEPYINECANIIIPLDLFYSEDGSEHANVIILHRQSSDTFSVERWDPWTYEGHDEGLDSYLSLLFRMVLSPMGYQSVYVDVQTACPNWNMQTVLSKEKGPHCRALDQLDPEGICTLLTLAYVALRLYRPNQSLDSAQINEGLQKAVATQPEAFCEFVHQLAASLIRQY